MSMMKDVIDELLDLLSQGGDVLTGLLATFPETLPTIADQLAGLLSLMTQLAQAMGPAAFARLVTLGQELDNPEALATALARLPDPQRERAEGMLALLDRWRGAAEDPALWPQLEAAIAAQH